MGGKNHLVLLALVISPLIVSYSSPTDAANILFFVGFGSPSHRMAMQPLADALAVKGHNVSFVVQYDPKADPSSPIQYFVSKKLADAFNFVRTDSSGKSEINFYDMRVAGGGLLRSVFVQTFGLQVCETLYSEPEFMEWFRNSPRFDLVILDALFNECAYGLAYAHGAKTMLFSISTILPWVTDTVGVPDESAWIPDVMSNVPLDVGFSNRVYGAVVPIFWRMFRQWYYFPRLEQITKKGLNLEILPSYAELERNTSLMLVNVHPAQELPRALPPNIIPVGGMSWVDKKNRKPLPQKMSDFIAEGKEGFIYVSFGSFIDFLTFPDEVQQTFINALKQFPNIQFIWKLNKTPENLPKHIMVEKWLPQQELLLHPSIRAFITHSGIGGVTEAIYSSVPLICFPMQSEQDYNAQLVQKRGFGIKMEITKLTQEGMVEAIRKIITDDSYKKNVERVTDQFLDRPMKPVDTAVWYTEFVLRQESTDYLRSRNPELSFFVRRQLDVWLLILLVTISVNSIAIYVSCKLLKRCFGNKSNKKSKDGKQKQN